MIRVQSFKIEDAEGINALLDKYRLAANAHILVSNGYLAIPYEDGEPYTPAQKAISVKEQRSGIESELDIVVHSQRVLEKQIEKGKAQLRTLQTDLEAAQQAKKEKDNKHTYVNVGKIKEAIQNQEKQLQGAEMQHVQNEHEIERMKVNIQVFNETLQELES